MTKRIDTRKRGRTSSVLTAKKFILAGFAVIIALGISSLALYTRPAATQELDKNMPTLSGDAAGDDLGSLASAIEGAIRNDNPEAQIKLTANDGVARDYFGRSVAVSGDTVIVGAPSNAFGDTTQGAAYIFLRNGTAWTLQQKLTAPDSAPGDPEGFGVSVAITGDTVIVGAPGHAEEGAAYVFIRNGTIWTLQRKFTPNDDPTSGANSQFGRGVAISGETVVIGSAGDDEGFAHVFVRDITTWTLQATLSAGESGGQSGFFGDSVAISGNAAVIGDPSDDIGSNIRQGSAYIFVRCGTMWARQQKLLASDGAAFDDFGTSVAISGGTVVIGSPGHQIGSNSAQGSAYTFVYSDPTWTQQQKLIAGDGTPFSRFGTAVAVLGNTAVIGSPFGENQTTRERGSAYVFVRNGTTWTFNERIRASDGANFDVFGSSVAISADLVVAGAPQDGIGANVEQGSAYVIDRISSPGGPAGPTCEVEIEVNITTDQPDIDLEDDVCDVDMGQSGQQCSLRAAIQTANAKDGPDEIKFNISGGGVHTISPASALPAITEKVTIDGTTQPGYAGAAPKIEVQGSLAGSNANGFVFAAGSNQSTVKALTINRFDSAGIKFESNDNNLTKSYIGLGSDGTTIYPIPDGQAYGIMISGARNLIGGNRTQQTADNYITGNYIEEIQIGSANATENRIIGNEIGRLPDGKVVPGGTESQGIVITDSSSANTIGGSSLEETNGISSGGAAIEINQGAHHNIITGNDIALSETGVLILNASDNRVGGINLSIGKIEGNNFEDNESGIIISEAASVRDSTPSPSTVDLSQVREMFEAQAGTASARNKVFGNVFSVSDPAPKELTNAITVLTAEDTLVGAVNRGNTIVEQTNAAIVVGNQAVRTIIEDNLIGLGPNGTARPNLDGIRLAGSGTTVRNNVISGNTETGIVINRLDDADPIPTENTIINNRIGTNAVGTTTVANSTGVSVEGRENTISSNIISGNTVVGIDVIDNLNTISQNKIGPDITGNTALANFGGITVSGSQNQILQNTVSGNTFGIVIAPFQESGTPIGNLVKGNFIGTNSSGNAALQNTLDGIVISNARTTIIGGLGPNIPTDRNIISGNGRHGISLAAGATQNRISGNYIGTGINGVVPIGNVGNGIRVGDSCSSTIIGGPEENSGNTIAYNGINGISLSSDAGNNNIIDPNSIFGNALRGIDLGEDGFTPNDPTDADTGPNKRQNYPTMTLSIVGGDLIVSYQVDSAPQHSTYGGPGIYVEFFEADATGAGRDFLGSDNYLLSDYNNGTPGTRQKNLGNAVALGIVAGDKLTATATDAEGNSSEFTPAVNAPGGAPGFEGDVAPRPNGDGNMLSTDITQMRRFVSGLDTPNPTTNEAQRIDSAPRSTFGDGIINSSDVVQGRRYVSGLDVMTPAGGPANRGGSVPESVFIPNRDIGLDPFQRELRIGEPQFRHSTAIVPIEMKPEGNEVALSFTLEYDPEIFSNPRIALGKFAPAGSTLTVNTDQPGRIGILIDSTDAMTASGIPLSIAMVSFEVKREAGGEEPIYMTGSLAATGISDAFGNSLSTKYVDGIVRFDAKMH